jgi:serine/threonine-protein kinase HipA
MRRCPITYEEIPDTAKYSPTGLKLLARNLLGLKDLRYSAEEQIQEALARATKMSIQGIQPKLSARLNVSDEELEIVDTRGEFILKPPTHFPEVPANEGLTMRMARGAGVEVPVTGLVYAKDGSFTYFVKRFDRTAKDKLPVEDFAQLLGLTRQTKYESSMERIASVLDNYCTFPALEKVKLFRLTLFNYLVGNEDAHLKNYSLITRNGKIELSPAYDLLNTTITVGNATEEIALPLNGKKRKLSRSDLVDYFGRERLQLTHQVISEVVAGLRESSEKWETFIAESFLSDAMRSRYREILGVRLRILFGD